PEQRLHMRKLLSVAIGIMIGIMATAQIPAGNRGGGAASQMTGSFYGKIIDSITGKPIEAASVQLVQNRLDTVSKQRKDVIVGGQLTKNNGDFNIENIPIMGQYVLRISAIGFKPHEAKVSLVDMAAMRNMQNNPGQNQDMSAMLG